MAGVAALACVALVGRHGGRRPAHFAVALASRIRHAAADGPVHFAIDARESWPISRFIYGANFVEPRVWGTDSLPPFTLDRLGGNRMSAYNWENNFSNAGNDYRYENDAYLGDARVPGEAVRSRVAAAFARGEGAIVTVPMLGYVAADGAGPMDVADSTRARRLATRFRISRASKGAPFTGAPDTTDDYVYQDEFVASLEKAFPRAAGDSVRPLWFALDNEPDLWTSTHEEIESKVGERVPRVETYDGFIDRTITYADAIKRVAPAALVFGPDLATWAGMATLGRYPTPDPAYGRQFFVDVYLSHLRAASARAGRRLLDVLALHWYPEISVGGTRITSDGGGDAVAEARMQAPRSLWDPAFVEQSWVPSAAGGPVRLLPRLRAEIAREYPGTRVALTEYYYGGGGDISGGIAEADVLGILGREGVFAANLWPAANATAAHGRGPYAWIFGAFEMFRDYDGQGGRFGDRAVRATTDDAIRSSVYASRDARGRVVLVAINKTANTLPATVRLTGAPAWTHAGVYALTAASPRPARQADLAPAPNGDLAYRMPARSVSTLVLEP